MAENISELLAEIQDLTAKLELMGFGGETESVTHNSVTRPTLQKAIEDKFLMLQSFIQGQLAFETKALMEADLNHAPDVIARVWNDTVENCGIYGKQGASGSGSWIKSNYDPLAFSYRSDFSTSSLSAGFEPVFINQYSAVGGAILEKVGNDSTHITVDKQVTVGSDRTWYGAWIEITYSSIDELAADFLVNIEHVSGESADTFVILKGMGDWSPSNHPIHVSGEKFNTPINLASKILNSGDQEKIDFYTAASKLYIGVGRSKWTHEAKNSATSVWKVQSRINKSSIVVASDLSGDLHDRIRSEIKAASVNSSTHAGIEYLAQSKVYPQTGRDLRLVGAPGAGGVIATKFPESASYSWYGLRVEINYNDLTDLDVDLLLNFEHISGLAPNMFLLTDGKYDDWNPANNVVYLGQVGSGPYNIYNLIVEASKAAEYSALNAVYINIAVGAGDSETMPAAQSVWKIDPYLMIKGSKVIANQLTPELQENLSSVLNQGDQITCWGDSLTAGGGWTARLAELSGCTVHNGGTGGENSQTIMARQGADVMIVDGITIPADTTPVLVADRDLDYGIQTSLGNKVTPLLQGSAHVNPVIVAGIEGTLSFTGSSYSDMTGDWVFSRTIAGSEFIINRPSAIRTAFDRSHNSGIQIVFIGQNGGYSDVPELVWQNRKMIEHSGSEKFVVLGLSSGSAAARADYETAMKSEFGRRFISLREYLSAPVYDVDGTTIISCYGLDDAGLTPSQSDLDAIATGTVPPQCLSDAVHYTTATKTVIGEMLFKKMTELNFFS